MYEKTSLSFEQTIPECVDVSSDRGVLGRYCMRLLFVETVIFTEGKQARKKVVMGYRGKQ